jgi:hypothetical protein
MDQLLVDLSVQHIGYLRGRAKKYMKEIIDRMLSRHEKFLHDD